ncbi:MAG: gliding motility-associated C-terminal domain-containing protein [Flavobacteriales bacterium]
MILTICSASLYAQGEYNQWYFGNGAALDFNSGNPLSKSGSAMFSTEGSASIADCNGNLLFYTNGSSVWNKNNQQMSNGFGLKGDDFSTQSALIVKRPNSSTIYYIFTASDEEGLNYSTVNMAANGGLGDVSSKNILLTSGGTQKITVTRHANGQDAWVISHENNNDRFNAFLVTASGVSSSAVISYSGPSHTSGHGDIKISPKGDKILTAVEFMDLITLSDFNNATGVVSNTYSSNKFPQPHGCEFSASGNFAYVSSACFFGSNCTNAGISQLNMSMATPSLIWSTSQKISGSSRAWGSMRRHTNGVIYCTDDESSYLGAIKNPDVLGTGTNYNHNAVYIGSKKAGWELPNDVLVSSAVVPGSISITATPGLCPEDSYTFNILSAQSVVSASWDFGDPASGFSNFSSQINPAHKFSAPGNYTVSVFINIDGCHTTSITKGITVLANPDANAGPDISICSGIPSTIGSAGAANYSYSWSPATGLSSATVANPVVTLTNNTLSNTVSSYFLTVSLKGCISRDTIHVTVRPLPVVDAGNNKAFCSSDTIQIGGATNPAVATYLWTPAKGLSSIAISNPLLTLENNNSTTDFYKYHITATGTNGCINKDSIQIMVYPLPNAGDSNVYVCPGDSIQLFAVSNGASYKWSPNLQISAINIYNPVVWPLFPRYYYLDVTDANGCKNLDSVFVNSTGTVPTSAGPDTSICRMDSVQIGGTPSAPPGTTYTWIPATGLSDAHSANPMASPAITTTYYLLTQNDTCGGIDSVVVTVHQLPNVDAGLNTEICFGDSLQLTATGAANYLWTPATNITSTNIANPLVFPKQNTVYKVLGTDIFSCENTDSIVIKVNLLPIANAGLDTGLCINDTIQLQASGGVSYLWKPSIGLSDSTIKNPLAFPLQTRDYVLQVTDIKGCKKKDTVHVSVHPLPVISTLNNTLICEGSSINLWAKGGVKYHWWPTKSLNDSAIANPTATPTSPTTYYVEVTDSYNCTDTASFDITLNIVPTAIFSVVNQTPGCEGYRTEFTNTSINADSQLWIYGDGSTSTEKVPQHTYPFGKNVVTQLIVTNNGLCSDTMSLPLNIKSIFDAVSITNGNVMTLNNDGINECFSVDVKDEFQGCVSLKIYDRWGLLMYSDDSYAYGKCWDGRNHQNMQAVKPGTYYYVLSIHDYSKTGFITVLGDE